MPVFVVIWHMGGGGSSLIFSKDRYLDHVFTFSDFVNFHVLLLAVPTFVFMANFLYVSRGISTANLRRRLKRVLILLTFWPIAFIIFRSGYHGLLQLFPRSLGSFAVTVLTAGHTIYYFFVSLIMCLLITHLIAHLNLRFQIWGFVLAIILLASLPILTKMTGFYPLSAYWSPLNFIPFPFAAVLIAQNMEYVRSKKILLISASLALSVLLSVLEWHYAVGEIFFPGQGYAIPAYTRASLLFSVTVLAMIATEPGIKSNGICTYMATYALALYCLHPFLMGPITRLVARITPNGIFLRYGSIILVILSSYALAMILRKYLKEKVIT